MRCRISVPLVDGSTIPAAPCRCVRGFGLSGGRMSESDDLRRIRVLRAGGYRCGVRGPQGVLCGAPASRVDYLFRYPICAECACDDEA